MLLRLVFLRQDVLLIYYTQWCGFCSAINHIVIQLARLLQGNPTITVARCAAIYGMGFFFFLFFFKVVFYCTGQFFLKDKKKQPSNLIKTFHVCRLNVARNDLPWEFMVDRVPSILLFPKYRQVKSQGVSVSRCFPVALY